LRFYFISPTNRLYSIFPNERRIDCRKKPLSILWSATPTNPFWCMQPSLLGLPVPEEVTLLSAGVVGYLATNPDQFPPPEGADQAVNPHILAAICFFAVFLSDLLVFWIGRLGAKRLDRSKRMQKYMNSQNMKKVVVWTQKYGSWMAGVFRFTPGIRFPGHMACGVLGLSPWKFMLVDGTAALLTVPTQVLLIAYYGEEILYYFKQFKIAILLLLLFAIVFFVFRKSKRISSMLWPEKTGSPEDTKISLP